MSKLFMKNNQSSMPLAIIIGILVSIGITIIGTILCTALISGGNITESTMSIMCPFIWFLASFAGAVASALIANRQYLIACGVPIACYLVILFTVSAMFLDGRYETIGWGILFDLLAATVALLVFLRKGSGKKNKI